MCSVSSQWPVGSGFGSVLREGSASERPSLYPIFPDRPPFMEQNLAGLLGARKFLDYNVGGALQKPEGEYPR